MSAPSFGYCALARQRTRAVRRRILHHLAITGLLCCVYSFPACSQQLLHESPPPVLVAPLSPLATQRQEPPFRFLNRLGREARDPLPAVSASYARSTEDFDHIVLSITTLKFRGTGIEAAFGTGFCLDSHCRFIVTNYHIAMLAQPHRINGGKILRRYLATGPEDEGATLVSGPDTMPLKFNLSRDLAIFGIAAPSFELSRCQVRPRHSANRAASRYLFLSQGIWHSRPASRAVSWIV